MNEPSWAEHMPDHSWSNLFKASYEYAPPAPPTSPLTETLSIILLKKWPNLKCQSSSELVVKKTQHGLTYYK